MDLVCGLGVRITDVLAQVLLSLNSVLGSRSLHFPHELVYTFAMDLLHEPRDVLSSISVDMIHTKRRECSFSQSVQSSNIIRVTT